MLVCGSFDRHAVNQFVIVYLAYLFQRLAEIVATRMMIFVACALVNFLFINTLFYSSTLMSGFKFETPNIAFFVVFRLKTKLFFVDE